MTSNSGFQRSWRCDGKHPFILSAHFGCEWHNNNAGRFSHQCGDRIDHYDDRDSEVRWKSLTRADEVLRCQRSLLRQRGTARTVWVTSSGTATLRRALPLGVTSVEAVFCAKQFVPDEHFGSNYGHDNWNRSGHEHADVLTGGSNAIYIYSGDFNNDGYVDLVVYDSALHTLQVFLGNSSGTFTTGASLATTVYSSWAKDALLMVADINRMEISTWSTDTQDSVSGNGNGHSVQAPPPINSVPRLRSLRLSGGNCHVNGDGKPDIVITCAEYSIVYTLLALEQERFRLVRPRTFPLHW